eukprot:TRINITY_DN24974_c0_g1_i1.p1 TRINITY_DN24974_c0_g1~~TRINITY_DN24974_c0_g1_i1.p1  ORF type:complete len:173 (-),score=10.13 TRINITY_DN24974_c0_g1_i1:65-583(-)
MQLLLAFLVLLGTALAQEPTQRVDFSLEYIGAIDLTAKTFSLKAESQNIRTDINPEGHINYHVQDRFFGSVSHINGSFAWVQIGKTFISTMDLSFGGSHVSQPHVLHLATISNGYMLPAHPLVSTFVSDYQIVSGEGAYANATGGVTVNGYEYTADNRAVWLISGLFWITPQ